MVVEPWPTVEVMLGKAILKPVIPEIREDAAASLEALVRAEREAKLDSDALRRLASLLPRDPQLAAGIAVRLKLSNRARQRLACAADAAIDDPKAVAYRSGVDCAVDRLLLANRAAPALPAGRRWRNFDAFDLALNYLP